MLAWDVQPRLSKSVDVLLEALQAILYMLVKGNGVVEETGGVVMRDVMWRRVRIHCVMD
jgi:hypothetical protein